MDIPKVIVRLEQTEAQALYHMADAECRKPDEQLRFLLRIEARRLGLLDNSPRKGESLNDLELGGTDDDTFAD